MSRDITTEQIAQLDEIMDRAKQAAAVLATYDQERVDRLCQALTAALYDLKVLVAAL